MDSLFSKGLFFLSDRNLDWSLTWPLPGVTGRICWSFLSAHLGDAAPTGLSGSVPADNEEVSASTMSNFWRVGIRVKLLFCSYIWTHKGVNVSTLACKQFYLCPLPHILTRQANAKPQHFLGFGLWLKLQPTMSLLRSRKVFQRGSTAPIEQKGTVYKRLKQKVYKIGIKFLIYLRHPRTKVEPAAWAFLIWLFAKLKKIRTCHCGQIWGDLTLKSISKTCSSTVMFAK